MIDISEVGNWFSVPKPSRTVSAVYLQGTFDIKEFFDLDTTPSLAITTGARYDNYDDVGATTNPRLGIVYSPIEKLYFKLLYGEAFRAPTLCEMYADSNPSTQGNPDIKPETISIYEFLVGYNFTNNFKSNVTFFYTKLEDVILRVGNPNPAFPYLYDNVGIFEGNGIEAELKYMMDVNKYIFSSLTFLELKDTTNDVIRFPSNFPPALANTDAGQGEQADFDPGNTPTLYGSIGLNYDFIKKIIANATINYIGERKRSEKLCYDGSDVVGIDQRDNLDGVFLVNASLLFNNFWKGLEIQISGYNILDADYIVPEPEGKVANDLPMAGSSFMATVAYAF